MFEGHEITRRSLLAGLAAASAAVAVPASALAAHRVENPLLLEMAGGIGLAALEVAEAEADLAAGYVEWEPRWPAIPEDLKLDYVSGGHYSEAKTLDGSNLLGERGRNVMVVKTDHLNEGIAAIRKALRRVRKSDNPFYAPASYTFGICLSAHEWTVELEKYRDLRIVAEAHEADQAAVRKASRIVERIARVKTARAGLEQVVGRTMGARPETVEGLIIQAQAMEAWQGAADWQKAMRAMDTTWAGDFAASLLRIAGAAA